MTDKDAEQALRENDIDPEDAELWMALAEAKIPSPEIRRYVEEVGSEKACAAGILRWWKNQEKK